VVLAGPHPLLGGTLHNNVVRGLGDGPARGGLATLRFNYRGVGQPRVNDRIELHFDQCTWNDPTTYERFLRRPACWDAPV
jgi:hypothetical protein